MKELEKLKVLLDLMSDSNSSNEAKSNHSFVIGESYFIRTVTMHFTGRLIAITETDLVLEDAAWIADSGRFSEALSEGRLGEVEPYPHQVIIGRAGIIDASVWRHDLPTEVR
jgi:hypothetical protein